MTLVTNVTDFFPFVAAVGILDAPMLSRGRPAVGLRFSIVRIACPNSTRTTLVARRLISNSTCCYAEHSNYSHRPKVSPSLSSGLDERSGHTHHRSDVEYDAQGNEINPYKNGPSALDKAVHLFFFTEIIRGA